MGLACTGMAVGDGTDRERVGTARRELAGRSRGGGLGWGRHDADRSGRIGLARTGKAVAARPGPGGLARRRSGEGWNGEVGLGLARWAGQSRTGLA
jgi:hypothetical protein